MIVLGTIFTVLALLALVESVGRWLIHRKIDAGLDPFDFMDEGRNCAGGEVESTWTQISQI